MFNYEEEINKLVPSVARAVDKIVSDLSKIDNYKILSLKPWKSNLPEILPFIGSKMEQEIKTYIKGLEIQAQDLIRRKEIAKDLGAITEDENQYFSTDWIKKNII